MAAVWGGLHNVYNTKGENLTEEGGKGGRLLTLTLTLTLALTFTIGSIGPLPARFYR